MKENKKKHNYKQNLNNIGGQSEWIVRLCYLLTIDHCLLTVDCCLLTISLYKSSSYTMATPPTNKNK